jgi:hypothetical protein
MQAEIVGYEEVRDLSSTQNERGQTTSLHQNGEIRYYLNVKFPNGTVYRMQTSKLAVDTYIAAEAPKHTVGMKEVKVTPPKADEGEFDGDCG